MAEGGRVVTAVLPNDVATEMDEVGGRIDRSKSCIIRQAVAEWLADERRRFELSQAPQTAL